MYNTPKENGKLRSVTFHMREPNESNNGYEWSRKNLEDLFANKRVIIFGLPGAFTPTCTNSQLPGYEEMFEAFQSDCGIDEIWCTSMNDAFTMFQWKKYLHIENVKMLPDGNGDFAESLGMCVDKRNLGFGLRSWRYAMVVNNLKIERLFEERGKMDNCPDDPYYYSSPEFVYEELKMGQPLSSAR